MAETQSSIGSSVTGTVSAAPSFIEVPVEEFLSSRTGGSGASAIETQTDTRPTLSQRLGDPANAVLESPQPSPPEAPQLVLQEWLGRVIEIGPADFVATLHDQTDYARPEEQVVIALNEVDASDLPLVSEGALFYLFVIREARKGAGRVVTDLRFRRLSRWSATELKAIQQRAEAKSKRLGIDSYPAAS